jgi:hypothetical protein
LKFVFPGGVYVGKNTLRGASVELPVFGGQPRRRAERIPSLSEKTAGFSDRLNQEPCGPLLSQFFIKRLSRFMKATECGPAAQPPGMSSILFLAPQALRRHTPQ